MLKDHRLAFYTDTGSYMGWTPWAMSHIEPEIIDWMNNGNAIKFNGTMHADLGALVASIQTEANQG